MPIVGCWDDLYYSRWSDLTGVKAMEHVQSGVGVEIAMTFQVVACDWRDLNVVDTELCLFVEQPGDWM